MFVMDRAFWNLKGLVGLVVVLLATPGCDRRGEGHKAVVSEANPSATTTAAVPSTKASVPTTLPVAESPEYLDVAEAVFRHQFDHNASGGQRRVDYFFLSLDGKDPPPEFLARFRDEKPVVLPRSLAKPVDRSLIGHKDLGGRGLIFNVHAIKMLDANTAEAAGGYYEADLSSSGNIYQIELRAGKWIVTQDTMGWIS